MAGKLHRNVASYEAYDASVVPSFHPDAISRFVKDAQADIGTLADVNFDLLAALKLAEEIMAGFEDDALQEGINQRLASIRTVIAGAEALQ
ncbi:hypothetical protein [Devosia ginsengisoli]|uniref:hypothetical protein n=1 Tax=Devosia ginsengisoli TaxID=400770 RepID=UPI0026EB9521|nr:hypothetical protein [Devosia ginsengisoli]MCR6672164.1 hypothetical protein [Devosia ginsengisoli]